MFPAQRQRDEGVGFREPAFAEVPERDVDETGFGVEGGTGEFGEPDGEEIDVQVLVLHHPDVAQEQDVLRDDGVEKQVRPPGEARPPLVEGVLRNRFLGFHERGGGLAADVDLGEGGAAGDGGGGDGDEERARDDGRGRTNGAIRCPDHGKFTVVVVPAATVTCFVVTFFLPYQNVRSYEPAGTPAMENVPSSAGSAWKGLSRTRIVANI